MEGKRKWRKENAILIYYAHSNDEIEQHDWHLLKDHLQSTADLAARLAKPWGAGKIAYVVGLLHDLGKYAPEFQSRLLGSTIKVDHSTAGAVEAKKRYGPLGLVLAYIIAGHHCGLQDWGSSENETSLAARFEKELNDYSAFSREIKLPSQQEMTFPPLNPALGQGFSVQFLIRFLYSCLVDADFLDTEKALAAEKFILRRGYDSIPQLAAKLDEHLDQLCAKASTTLVNQKRAEILSDCRHQAVKQPGLFTLTVPTGGGKTLSSLSFALRHALKHGQKRIIYVIPYTSIIEQNAAVFRNILGINNVLEHHSNFTYPQNRREETESEYVGEIAHKLKLAAENWDMPVVVTTNIQFFESLFAAKSSKCRKLHNIANSVVIVDEAQMLPIGFLKPCLNALAELVINYKTSVVLCTATQPAIGQFLPRQLAPTEIISDPVQLYKVFKRVQVQNIGQINDDELAKRLAQHRQVLCIVNSKKHARILYDKIDGEKVFHLSTRMCPAHRSKILETIKKRLRDQLPCQVVSTQLIEAGVDIDFPYVYRSMAGIDSIAQSAGRCNREGLLKTGQVYVFRPETHGMPKGWLSRVATIGGQVLGRHDDPLGLAGVKDYFSTLYNIDATELDQQNILAEIAEQQDFLRFPFRTIANKFKLIDQSTSTIIVPWDDECEKTLSAAAASKFVGVYARKLQKYGVALYDDEFNELFAAGALELIADRFYVLKHEFLVQYYCQNTGLRPFTPSMFINDVFVI